MQSIVKYAMRGRTVKRFAASAAVFAMAMAWCLAFGQPTGETCEASAKHGGLEVDPDVVVLPGGDGLEVRTEAVKGAVGNYRRTIVSIRNKSGTPVQIDDIGFFRDWAPGGIRDGYRSGDTDGSVAIFPAKRMFAGVEHPMAKLEVEDGAVTAHLPRNMALAPGEAWRFSYVVGRYEGTNPRRSFQEYLEAERAHPYRVMPHYNSWFDLNINRNDLPWEKRMDEAEALGVMKAFRAEMNRRGVFIASYLWDDGWDEWNSLWDFHPGFPNGFAKLAEEAHRDKGASIGCWMSPCGGYGQSLKARIAYSRSKGYIGENDGVLRMSNPTYYAAFRDRVLDMIARYDMNLFKFDRMGNGRSDNVGCDTEYAPEFDAVVRLIGEMRRAKPDVFVNCTVGTWASPFWVMFADSIWRGGRDFGRAGTGTDRQKWITYRDKRIHDRFVAPCPLFPLNSMMMHGIIVSKSGAPGCMDVSDTPQSTQDFSDEVWMGVGCGTGLQEYYITPDLMHPRWWDILADGVKWIKANERVLRDVHWVGGDPVDDAGGEIYGYASAGAGKGVVTLRNPSDRPLAFSAPLAEVLDLPEAEKGAEVRNQRTVYAHDAEIGKVARASDALSVRLAPHAMAVMEFMFGRVVTDLSGEGWTLDGKPVEVPHTWNAIDGADGIGERRHHANSVAAQSYSHRRGVYRRNLPAAKAGRRYFVRFRGASQRATVRVNGTTIGHHVGAFTVFCCEATRQMKPEVNLLEVEVENIYDPDIPPASGDFTVYGGLHRGVELIETDAVCIDCTTDGADGVRLDVNPDSGEVVAFVTVDGGTNEVQRFSFPDRELWSPENPRLYEIEVAIAQGGCRDAVRKTFGFRKAEFREDGFYLNGVKRKIRGVNMHSDLDGFGWALPKGQRAKDIAMVKEMGADGLRAAHYPHDDETYAECDRQGLLVWCEYPNLGYFTPTEAYRRNAMQGIREMVAQLGAHPSIIAWSVSNEYIAGKKSPAEWLERLLREFTAEVRRLDQSRPSAAATFKPLMTAANAIPDVLGFNFYPGWYKQEPDEMPVTIDAALAETRRGMIAVTEYGAGGNADCHESPDVRNAPLGAFHSEEYQAWVHHFNYLGLKDDPRLWGTFVWCMFDFGADARREGSRFGLNDKGLVAYDHETRKDAFWFYKANWTKEPFLHLVGSRMASTTNSAVTVMAFWNGEGAVSLKVNGENRGSLQPDSVNTAIWRDVNLRSGDNEIEVSAGGMSRRAYWRLKGEHIR